MTPRSETLAVDRRTVKEALRSCGLSDRQVRALLSRGWAALVGEATAEADELRDHLAAISSQLERR